MNEYRVQRLKEELTYAQQRNKHQKKQLANYKNVHEKDLKEIERLENIIKEVREYIKQTGQYLEDIKRFNVNVLEPNYLDILQILDKENI